MRNDNIMIIRRQALLEKVIAMIISRKKSASKTILFLLLASLIIESRSASAQVSEPYRPLHGGAYNDQLIAGSPDPLVNYRWHAPSVKDSLQVYIIRPEKIRLTPEAHFSQDHVGETITVSGPGDILIDFGQENAGWLEFDSEDPIDSVTASISEYNEPAIVNTGAEHRFKTAVPIRYGNTYRLELNKELYEGVRFAWIHIHDLKKKAYIKNIRLVCQTRPVNYQGSFSSSDTMLTRIWYTGAYTVRLNLLQDYFGDILMERSDRHSWTGDAYPAQAAALVAFGNYDMVRQNLAFTSGQDNGIAAYSLYWVLSLIDYYRYTGDTAFIKKYLGNVEARLQKAYDSYDSLPPLNFMGWDERLGAGFEDPQTQEAKQTYRMLCIGTWMEFAKVMTSLKEDVYAEKYRGFARSKIALLLADTAQLNTFGVHAISEAIKAGLGDNPIIKKISDRIYADPIKRLSYSPFNQYFILQAMSAGKYYDAALQSVDDLWGGQIRYGGTSFFEVYRPSWNTILGKNDPVPNNQCGYTSLCHPWSAGVTKWLSENIAGIKPLTAGFRHFQIKPHLGSHLDWVKGVTPTPYGSITANFNSQTGDCLVIVPAGTTADIVALPKMGRKIKSVLVNGRLLYDNSGNKKKDNPFRSIAGIASSSEDQDYLNLTMLQPGSYAFKITYGELIGGEVKRPTATHSAPQTVSKRKLNNKGINETNEKGNDNDYHKSKAGAFTYPISFSQDSVTKGNWLAKYGKEGYRLLGAPKNQTTEKLPEQVRSIDLRMEKTISWKGSTPGLDSASILQMSGLGTKSAATMTTATPTAMAIATRDPLACKQTMTVDVQLKSKHRYSISVYLLDGDQQNRSTALELFDLQTKEMIAPVMLVQRYGKGKYIRFTCERSFRLRIDQVRGENAVISGIFFDEPEPRNARSSHN